MFHDLDVSLFVRLNSYLPLIPANSLIIKSNKCSASTAENVTNVWWTVWLLNFSITLTNKLVNRLTNDPLGGLRLVGIGRKTVRPNKTMGVNSKGIQLTAYTCRPRCTIE